MQPKSVSEAVFLTPKVRVARVNHLRKTILFAVRNPRDVIQREHVAGRFYEPEELGIIANHFPLGGQFCDIGANVGNHTLYVAMFLHAERIVLVEPNPDATDLLRSNVFLNGLEKVCDLRHLGIGLSDGGAKSGGVSASRKNNLGGARMVENEGDIPLITGDALLAGEKFDMIKIDVEGMEMKVLNGMENLLRRTKPKLFVEVDRQNFKAFDDFCATHNYEVLEQFKRYRPNTNFLLGPRLE